jgi:hypothetical protein
MDFLLLLHVFLLLSTSPLLTSATSIRLRKSYRASTSTHHASIPSRERHLQFYDGVRKELKKLTSAVRLEQPIDSNSSFLKDFQNKAVLMNRGLNKARLQILKHKKELDEILRQDLKKIQDVNDQETEKSQQYVNNVTDQTNNYMKTVETKSGDDEAKAQYNTTHLKKRKQELELLIPSEKLLIPELRQKVRSAILSYDVHKRHLYFQQHELTKMERVSDVAAKYAKGFVSPPKEALALSREIARTGLNAMKAPANMARLAKIKMIENELTVIANIRSALAKEEIMNTKGMNLKQIIKKMHEILEGELPSLKFGKESRLTMFHECTGRGGSTLTSGSSACKKLLILHTPVLFRKHLNAVIKIHKELAGLTSVETGAKIIAVEDKENLTLDKNDLMKKVADNVRFSKVEPEVDDAATTIKKMLPNIKKGDEQMLKDELRKGEEEEEEKEMKEDAKMLKGILDTDKTSRDPPGKIMAEISKLSDELKKEDPQGEKSAEEEDNKMKHLEKSQQLMSAAKPVKEMKSSKSP